MTIDQDRRIREVPTVILHLIHNLGAPSLGSRALVILLLLAVAP